MYSSTNAIRPNSQPALSVFKEEEEERRRRKYVKAKHAFTRGLRKMLPFDAKLNVKFKVKKNYI